ncbi:DUF7715 family protein [Amnibacterium kyonggiense]|uniref:DUF7715 domain-containing protein n=1 Tax=Amnibacterium kyonggiense TaxID=595671 RepID=A0A4R7FMN0_9MICO|nr:hypothetical protein [Amnibacterium kyonggiense]TDS77598.1 hypothetical protein CLV52_2556 [Amnibacterium kyonggiense]
MRKNDPRIDGAPVRRPTQGRGTAVLLAVDGFSEPGRECVPGELLMPPAGCGRANCTCEDDFHGVASHGVTSIGRVRLLRGVSRALVAGEIAAALRQDGEVDDPLRRAIAYLDEVATIEEGRLVRREVHVLLPFPAAARIVAPHEIEYRLDDAP